MATKLSVRPQDMGTIDCERFTTIGSFFVVKIGLYCFGDQATRVCRSVTQKSRIFENPSKFRLFGLHNLFQSARMATILRVRPSEVHLEIRENRLEAISDRFQQYKPSNSRAMEKIRKKTMDFGDW